MFFLVCDLVMLCFIFIVKRKIKKEEMELVAELLFEERQNSFNLTDRKSFEEDLEQILIDRKYPKRLVKKFVAEYRNAEIIPDKRTRIHITF